MRAVEGFLVLVAGRRVPARDGVGVAAQQCGDVDAAQADTGANKAGYLIPYFLRAFITPMTRYWLAKKTPVRVW